MITFPYSSQQAENRVGIAQPDTTSAMDVKPVFDTAAYCSRNSISGITFHDKDNFITQLDLPRSNKTIIYLARQSKVLSEANKEILISRLQPGISLPESRINEDWMIFVIVLAALLLTLVRSSKKAYQNIESFFMFRGATETGSHNPTGLFQWQTTIRNLASFIIISLFIFKSVSLYSLIPPNISNIAVWLICLGCVILAITMRHIICIITGNLSGTTDVFNEYLSGVYQSYHFSALILALLIVMMTYTVLIPSKAFIIAGAVAFGIMYLFRIARLLIIFINRNISILYLILYLCALEILPVAIAIRYFSQSA